MSLPKTLSQRMYRRPLVEPTSQVGWSSSCVRFHSMKLRCYKLHRIRSSIFIARRHIEISSKNRSFQIAHCSVESTRILIITLNMLLIYIEKEEGWFVRGGIAVGRRNDSWDEKWYNILKISIGAYRAKYGIFHYSCIKYSIEITFPLTISTMALR